MFFTSPSSTSSYHGRGYTPLAVLSTSYLYHTYKLNQDGLGTWAVETSHARILDDHPARYCSDRLEEGPVLKIFSLTFTFSLIEYRGQVMKVIPLRERKPFGDVLCLCILRVSHCGKTEDCVANWDLWVGRQHCGWQDNAPLCGAPPRSMSVLEPNTRSQIKYILIESWACTRDDPGLNPGGVGIFPLYMVLWVLGCWGPFEYYSIALNFVNVILGRNGTGEKQVYQKKCYFLYTRVQ